jgi:hypothetical protein
MCLPGGEGVSPSNKPLPLINYKEDMKERKNCFTELISSREMFGGLTSFCQISLRERERARERESERERERERESFLVNLHKLKLLHKKACL